VITAAAIYARVFLYVYIISVYLKDLIIISVVITVDVKVYTEAMLVNTIYLYLIFRLRFLSPLSLYSYFSRQLNDSRFLSTTRSNFSLPRNFDACPECGRRTFEYFLFLTAAIAVSISHVRACLCKAWHLQDMKINCTRQNCAQRLCLPSLLRFRGTKNSRGTEA